MQKKREGFFKNPLPVVLKGRKRTIYLWCRKEEKEGTIYLLCRKEGKEGRKEPSTCGAERKERKEELSTCGAERKERSARNYLLLEQKGKKRIHLPVVQKERKGRKGRKEGGKGTIYPWCRKKGKVCLKPSTCDAERKGRFFKKPSTCGAERKEKNHLPVVQKGRKGLLETLCPALYILNLDALLRLGKCFLTKKKYKYKIIFILLAFLLAIFFISWLPIFVLTQVTPRILMTRQN